MSGVWDSCRRCGLESLFPLGTVPEERICGMCRRGDDALRRMMERPPLRPRVNQAGGEEGGANGLG